MMKRVPGIFLQRSRVVGRRRLKKARVQVCLRREINTEEKQLTPVWLSSFCDDVFSSLSLWSKFAAHAVCRQVIRPISSTANWAILVTAASRYSREYTEQKLAVMLPSIVLEPPSNSHHVLLLLLLRRLLLPEHNRTFLRPNRDASLLADMFQYENYIPYGDLNTDKVDCGGL